MLAAMSVARRNPVLAEDIKKEILLICNNTDYALTEPLRYYLETIANTLATGSVISPDLTKAQTHPKS